MGGLGTGAEGSGIEQGSTGATQRKPMFSLRTLPFFNSLTRGSRVAFLGIFYNLIDYEKVFLDCFLFLIIISCIFNNRKEFIEF